MKHYELRTADTPSYPAHDGRYPVPAINPAAATLNDGCRSTGASDPGCIYTSCSAFARLASPTDVPPSGVRADYYEGIYCPMPLQYQPRSRQSSQYAEWFANTGRLSTSYVGDQGLYVMHNPITSLLTTLPFPGLAKNLHLESNNNTPTRSRRTRSSTATKRTRDRDELKCVVTNQSDPLEVAHIFPLSSYSNGHSQASFLSLLELFASPDIAYNVSTYLGLLPSPSGPPQPPSQLKINRLENLITLLQPVHSYLDDGKIILEPVGDPLSIFDNPDPADPPVLTHYDVIFSYLPSHRTPAGPAGWDQTSVTQTEPIATLQYTEHTDPVLSRLGLLRRGTSWEVLTTGTVIRLVTTDPAKRPLPHPDLLRLHAALSRVVRCAAAAEPKITGYDEDSEEEEEEGVEENLPVHGDPEAAKKVWKYLESHEGSEEEEGVKGHRPVHGDPEAEKAWKYLGSLPSPWNTHGQRTFCT